MKTDLVRVRVGGLNLGKHKNGSMITGRLNGFSPDSGIKRMKERMMHEIIDKIIRYHLKTKQGSGLSIAEDKYGITVGLSVI